MYRRGSDHTVEGGEAMLVANLLTVQLKLRLTHLPIHVQRYHGLQRGTEGHRGCEKGPDADSKYSYVHSTL